MGHQKKRKGNPRRQKKVKVRKELGREYEAPLPNEPMFSEPTEFGSKLEDFLNEQRKIEKENCNE